jgi:hypothetical protein
LGLGFKIGYRLGLSLILIYFFIVADMSMVYPASFLEPMPAWPVNLAREKMVWKMKGEREGGREEEEEEEERRDEGDY